MSSLSQVNNPSYSTPSYSRVTKFVSTAPGTVIPTVASATAYVNTVLPFTSALPLTVPSGLYDISISLNINPANAGPITMECIRLNILNNGVLLQTVNIASGVTAAGGANQGYEINPRIIAPLGPVNLLSFTFDSSGTSAGNSIDQVSVTYTKLF